MALCAWIRIAGGTVAYDAPVATGGTIDYDTEGWTNARRGEVTTLLLDAGVPHEWDGTTLRLPALYQETADRILF